MPDVAKALRTQLLTVTDITNQVSTRVYWDTLPQAATLPAIVVQMTGTDRQRNIGAAEQFYRSTVQLEVYADSHADAVTVGDLVETNVEFDAGTWGTLTVSRSLVETVVDVVEAPADGSDAWRRIRSMSIVVWHS